MGITPQQLQQIQNRLNGVKRPAEASTPVKTASHQIILGIDPSLRGTGYGVIHIAKPHAIAVSQGCIPIPASWEHSRCLVKIYQTIRDVIAEHKPTACVLEGLFFAQNLQTALIMGQARGASMVAAGEAGLELFEISPRKMKQAIVGHGAAQKSAIAKMVQRLLHLVEEPGPDAADALALALAYAHENSRIAISARKRI